MIVIFLLLVLIWIFAETMILGILIAVFEFISNNWEIILGIGFLCLIGQMCQ